LSEHRVQQPPITLDQRFQVMLEHSEHFEALCAGQRFVAMRKHLTWYCRDFRGAAEMRSCMTRAASAGEVAHHLSEFLAPPGSALAPMRFRSDRFVNDPLPA
jgi:tRNA-dihydrouridine synthase